MNQVTGKIVLHETGAGIPNLIVTVYDVDFDTLRKDAIQSRQGIQVATLWEQLQGDRLGSVLTGEDGTFLVEYEIKNIKKTYPTLLLFVTAPESPELDGFSPMLHVSSGIRQNAGRIESYLIRLTAEELKKAGVALPQPAQEKEASKAHSWSQFKAEVRKRETHKILERVRAVWSQDNSPDSQISDIYQQKVDTFQVTEAGNRIPLNGFRLALPVINTGGDRQIYITFDGESKKWFMHKGDQKDEIVFDGPVSESDLKTEDRPSGGISIVLHENEKKFNLVFANPVFSLRKLETSPGELFIWNLKRRYVKTQNQQKPVEPVASDDWSGSGPK